MGVYNPTGSGGVHTDRIMSGGKRVAKGMGFAAAAASAAKKAGVPLKQGQAMVAAASRSASPAAKKANPNLKKVTMPGKKRSAATPIKKTSGNKGTKSNMQADGASGASGGGTKRARSAVNSKRQRIAGGTIKSSTGGKGTPSSSGSQAY